MSWKWEYIFLIIISTIIDYTCARKISSSKNQKTRKIFLFISLSTNLSILFFFKYYEFFIRDVLHIPTYEILNGYDFLLPVGISFYTFQTMSYTIDVYKKKIPSENHFGRFALFVTYFPQLVAGPIERAGHIIHQIKNELKFNPSNLKPAAKLFLIGLFKKVVIADRLSLVVDPVFNAPTEYSSLTFIFASCMFAIQIYCDFSGYSDMAIGISKVFNIDLMKNFNSPYLAKNISQFWSRWHISLSTWFRDYVYIPLGGNRVVKWRWYYNLLITFILSGIWHGANWTFVIWGCYHGLLLILEKITPSIKVTSSIKIFTTFFLVVLGWISFRANNLSDALYIYKTIFSTQPDANLFVEEIKQIGLSKLNLIVALFAVTILFLKDLNLNINSTPIKWGYYYILVFSIIIFGIGGANSFIYFQF